MADDEMHWLGGDEDDDRLIWNDAAGPQPGSRPLEERLPLLQQQAANTGWGDPTDRRDDVWFGV